MRKGQLFVISGPSGVGKGTICKKLIDELGLKFSVSMTTRKPRDGEKHGEAYYFVTHEEFNKIKEQNGFLEYAEVFGNYYGTPRLQTEQMMEAGIDVLLDIDTQGAISIRNICSEDAVFVFILPPSLKELKNRIEARGSETEESMKRRLSAASSEISLLDNYDYCVVNDNLEIAVEQVKSIVRAERSRVPKDKGHLNEILCKYKEED